MLVLPHLHVRERDFVPGENFAHARIDALLQHKTVCSRRLLEVREMRALDTLLPHPNVARIECEIVAGGPRAEDDHAAALYDQAGNRKRLLARVFEYNVDIFLARDVPDRLAEASRFLRPLVELGRVHCRHLAPALELLAIDHALGAQIENILALRLIGDDSDRIGAGSGYQLHAEYAEAS